MSTDPSAKSTFPKSGRNLQGSPGPAVREILSNDERPVPPALAEFGNDYLGDDFSSGIHRDRYISPEFFRLEGERMWPRTWQMVCRAEEIPKVGDHVIFEIMDNSLIVVRAKPDQIKAFHNVCLHRGRILRETGGNVPNLRCKFHGFAWSLDGALSSIPCRWDFPNLKEEEMALPEARVGLWAGFVFINLDPNAMSLEEYLGEIPNHFRSWHFEDRYIAAHVGILVNANWKVAVEAGMEAMHVVATHRQALSYMADINAQYDAVKNRPHYSRLISPLGVPSPFVADSTSEQEIIDSMFPPQARGTGPGKGIELPADKTARQMAAEILRKQMSSTYGRDFSSVSDSEMLDLIIYSIFPNFYIQGGYFLNTTLFYRYRPWNSDPELCLWEIYVLLPTPKNSSTPDPAAFRLLKPGETLLDAHELGPAMSSFLNQDLGNMAYVQKGLRATRKPQSVLARYQESQIRHFHRTLDMYLSADTRK
ncbi:MAG: aromatic ring-hydroxylating dioxygenase subunit alpha [Deltaproteobacteria bacterium]|nr:aromatic ring-hydroxylating dioxygenase subunit alpha [Deltaproteobacteria bacterium]